MRMHRRRSDRAIDQRPANLGKNALIRSRQKLSLKPACLAAAAYGPGRRRRTCQVIHDLDLRLSHPRKDVKLTPPLSRPNIRRRKQAGATPAEELTRL